MYTSSQPCAMTANALTGTVAGTNCRDPTAATADTAGAKTCSVSGGAFGDAFNHNGGGVWALRLEESGVKAWYFARGNVPADLKTGAPNPAAWGTPVLSFGKGRCDVLDAFKKLKIVSCTSHSGCD